MKKCSKCKVNVNSHRKTCPLCGQILDNPNKETQTMLYPPYNSNSKKINLFLRILLFTSIITIVISLLINLLTNPKHLWSIYVIIGVFYGLILIRSTIMSKSNVALRLVIQMITLSIVVVAIEELSDSGSWALDYVIPFICIVTTLSIIIIIISKPMIYSDYLFYLLIAVIIGFVPLILYFTKIVDVLWPSISAAGVSIITIFGMIFFADRATKDELKKRFHL